MICLWLIDFKVILLLGFTHFCLRIFCIICYSISINLFILFILWIFSIYGQFVVQSVDCLLIPIRITLVLIIVPIRTLFQKFAFTLSKHLYHLLKWTNTATLLNLDLLKDLAIQLWILPLDYVPLSLFSDSNTMLTILFGNLFFFFVLFILQNFGFILFVILYFAYLFLLGSSWCFGL